MKPGVLHGLVVARNTVKCAAKLSRFDGDSILVEGNTGMETDTVTVEFIFDQIVGPTLRCPVEVAQDSHIIIVQFHPADRE